MAAPDSALLDRLRAVLAAADVRLAVLFGSHARGEAGATSDVDVGILPRDPRLALSRELELAAALSRAAGAEVDLVRLDRDDPLLGREVARDGVCLFAAEPGLFAAYRAEATSRWLEFDETVAPHRDRFLRRIAGGSR